MDFLGIFNFRTGEPGNKTSAFLKSAIRKHKASVEEASRLFSPSDFLINNNAAGRRVYIDNDTRYRPEDFTVGLG